MRRAPGSGKEAPATVRPRTKPAEVRREELLDAAERIFLAKGIAATSVDEIAAAADVAKGTFYIHFASKEKLLAALQQRYIARFCNDLLAALNRRRSGDWKGRLRSWIETAVSLYFDRSAIHDLVFHEFRPEEPHEKKNLVVQQLAAFLEQGAQAGAWSVEDPHLLSVMLCHSLHGALDHSVYETTDASRKRLSRLIEAFFFRALAVE